MKKLNSNQGVALTTRTVSPIGFKSLNFMSQLNRIFKYQKNVYLFHCVIACMCTKFTLRLTTADEYHHPIQKRETYFKNISPPTYSLKAVSFEDHI